VATFAIGDIHGNVDALRDLLCKLDGHIRPLDEVVFLGDYIDRGSDSHACIEEVLAFRDRTTATVTCLEGNHEQWLLRTMADHTKHSWLLVMEALPTIRSYSKEAAEVIAAGRASGGLALYTEEAALRYELFFDAMPDTHRAFFHSLALVHVTTDAICAHAGIDPAVPSIEEQTARTLTWGASGFPDAHRGELPVIYGHFNDAVLDAAGWPHPRITEYALGIDTISHGVLTAVRLPDRKVFQSHRARP